jgi:hypothetical protein
LAAYISIFWNYPFLDSLAEMANPKRYIQCKQIPFCPGFSAAAEGLGTVCKKNGRGAIHHVVSFNCI